MSRKRPPEDDDDNVSIASSSQSFCVKGLSLPRTRSHQTVSSEDLVMDDCAAAMVLMSLSCSPKSPVDLLNRYKTSLASNVTANLSDAGKVYYYYDMYYLSYYLSHSVTNMMFLFLFVLSDKYSSSWYSTASSGDSGIESKSGSPESPVDLSSKKSVMFQCTWPGCGLQFRSHSLISRHVRTVHLGPTEEDDEDFYYTEIDVVKTDSSEGSMSPVSWIGAEAPTWSHLDMARPPTEDPEYLAKLGRASYPIDIPQQRKVMRVEKSTSLLKTNRRSRGETRKCRKVYGMDSRDSWCTQCKWKKACTRFAD